MSNNTQQPRDTNWFERTFEEQKKIFIEIGKKAITDFSKIKIGKAKVGERALTEAAIIGEIYGRLYREEISPRLTAGLLAINRNYIEQNPGMDLPQRFEQVKTQSKRSSGEFYDKQQGVEPGSNEWRRSISPGRAGLALIGDRLVPGRQAVDKLNWEDTNQVEEFFSRGLPQFFSGLIDAPISVSFDPWYRAAKLTGKVTTATLKRPIVQNVTASSRIFSINRIDKINKEIDDAAQGVKNGARPIFDAIAESKDIEDIIGIDFIANSASPGTAAYALRSAYTYGGDAAVADVMKVMTGNQQVLERLAQENTQTYHLLNRLKKQEESINEKLADVKAGIDGGSRLKISPAKAKQIEEANAKLVAEEEKLIEKKKALDVKLENAYAKKKNLDFRVGAVDSNVDKALTSTGTETLLGTANNTWSRFNKLEHIRTTVAKLNAKGYWGEIDPVDSPSLARQVSREIGIAPRFVRIGYYLSPNQQLREIPADVAIVDGIPAKFSYKEVKARLNVAVKYAGMSPETARNHLQKYVSKVTPSQRFALLEDIEQESLIGVVKKLFPKQYGNLSESQEDAIVEWIRYEIRNSKDQRAKAFGEIIDKNYTNIDMRSGALIAQSKLVKLQQQLATAHATKNGRPKPIKEDFDAVDNSLKTSPAFSTQIPNMHFSADIQDVSNIIKENRLTIKSLLEYINEEDLTAGKIRELIKEEKVFRQANEGQVAMAGDYIMSRARSGKDRLTNAMDVFQVFVWKPATLLSLKYTTRNVFEGWLRTYATFIDMHANHGLAYTEMAKGFFGEFAYGPIRTAKNAGIRYSARRSERDLKKVNEKLILADSSIASELKKPNKNSKDFIRDAIKNRAETLSKDLLDAHDTVTMPLVVINAKLRQLENHIGSTYDSKAIKSILKTSKSLKKADGLTGKEADIAKLLFSGKYDDAYKLSLSMNSEEMSRILDNIGIKLDSLAAELIKYDKQKLSPNFSDTIDDIIVFIGRLDKHMDNAKQVFVQKDIATGNFIASQAKSSARGKIYKTFEGKKEIAKGVFIGKSLAGDAGELMRSQTSARISSQRMLNDDNRVTSIALLHAGKERAPISPEDPLWAVAHAEYVNNVIMKDELSKRIVADLAKGIPVDKVKANAFKWINDGSFEARKYMRDIQVNLRANYEPNGWGISEYINTQVLQIEAQYLRSIDELGSPILINVKQLNRETGKVESVAKSLTQIANDGQFTPEVSTFIPTSTRWPVEGNTSRISAQANVVQNVVNSIFYFLSSLPEDHLVRHPFYNMIHDAEAMRVSRLIQRQAKKLGKSQEEAINIVAKNADKIKNVASTRAYKELMQRLYSVERYTDMASFTRFVSPFYMAQQNSSRFWLNTTFRNPQVAITIAHAYNAPYRSGYVQDEEGNVVSSGNPWSTRRDAIVLGLPESVLGYKIKDKTGKDIITFQPTAIDVITQGQIPGLQVVGGPFGQTALTYGLLKTHPDEITQKLFGKNATEIVGKYVMPYYEKTYGKSATDTLITNLNPMNSWMLSAMAAIGTGKAWYATPEANKRFDARFNTAWDTLVLQSAYEDKPLNDIELREQAADLAINSLWVEMASSFFGPVVSGKLGDSETRKLEQRYNKLIKDNQGNTDAAAIQLTQEIQAKYNTSMASSATKVITTRSNENRLGLLATPQTLRNVENNKALLEQIDLVFPDNPLLGEMLSAGDPKDDYSQFVEDKMYSISLNGVPLREALNNPKERAKRQQYSMAWEMYSSNVEYLESEAKRLGISKNSQTYKQVYKAVKDYIEIEVGKRYPLWAARPQTMQFNKSSNNLAIMDTLLSNDKFMKTVGNNSTAIQGLQEYMKARAQLVATLKAEAKRTGVTSADTKQNDWILELRDSIANDISNQYPGFERLYTRYLNDDMLEDIPTYTELGN